jgi:hypothetical protein
MNDLDDLIRASLHAHTPLAPPDDALTGRVVATGRRIRRARTVGAAAFLLVVVGVGWAVSTLPQLSRPVIAASPSVPEPTTGPASPPQTTPGPDVSVRDVSTIGEPAQFEKYEFLNNSFASPSGNLHCFINTAGAGCQATTWDAGVAPSQKKTCSDTEPVLGPEVWGSGKAAWTCGSDPHSLPYLGEQGGGQVTWWDATFGESVPSATDPTVNLAVLPYGKTLVAGDFRCSMAEDGVTCTNTRTGNGFHASRAKVDLTP